MLTSNHRGRGQEPVTVAGSIRSFVTVNMSHLPFRSLAVLTTPISAAACDPSRAARTPRSRVAPTRHRVRARVRAGRRRPAPCAWRPARSERAPASTREHVLDRASHLLARGPDDLRRPYTAATGPRYSRETDRDRAQIANRRRVATVDGHARIRSPRESPCSRSVWVTHGLSRRRPTLRRADRRCPRPCGDRSSTCRPSS